MRALLPRVASEGVTVILASHLLTEVQQVCDHVAIMQAGSIIARGSVESLLRREGQWRVLVEPRAIEAAALALDAMPATTRVELIEGSLFVDSPAGGADLNRALVEAGIYASEIEPVVPTLESVFIELTEGRTVANHRPAGADGASS